jgi:hypothetical protein
MECIPKDRAPLLEEWGWYCPDTALAQSLSAELQRELPPDHLLFGRAVEAVAYRQDQDDVLFHHQNEADRFTVIHLTWSRKKEIDADHPSICFDGSFEDFFDTEQKFYESMP